MRKSLYLFIVLTGFFGTVLAQQAGEKHVKQKKEKDGLTQHELAVNATFFVKQFLNFSEDDDIEISPYVLSYKRISPNLCALRLGFGIDLTNTTFDDDDAESERITKALLFDGRVGFEKQFKLGKAWATYVGVDLTGSFANNETTNNTGFEGVTTQLLTWGVGGGPVLGIQVHFTDRISLFTETAMYYSFEETEDKVTFELRPGFNDRDVTKVSRFRFVLPTSLYFAVRLFKKDATNN